MSGGHFDYINDSLCDTITGAYPRLDMNGEEQHYMAKAVRILNRLEDGDISEITYDVFCLLHSFDWYRSGDTGRSDYEADVKAFKEKWRTVVCCRDCENWDTDWEPGGLIENHFCPILGCVTGKYFFCARAEKRMVEA